ncbi:ATV_HP_G0045020.mRNA.1.CDS.1 [Saccharomyces cerevisiae]|nr:ATV_HP_G0119670.mRNA.1.CDS.1 [Saccharomyces cerevisiae]CAI5028705.1 ATV_HP_G0000970.mRNA.1.CDS.1 [Saccharomyces cerevisiae]CAI5120118.1 ATV_HP_G0045020.mRNA.1.CDS.1 [Saccharomyces cerevisiae]CAI6769780.1 ATV_HP_G0119670.mRNA.1.CDS.1 [Saccharomyces cerevisiae]CAI6946565.1 ATV_HP_G0000970.mRNA.1.CDS.1 [Saccharomyces cerevisiae]
MDISKPVGSEITSVDFGILTAKEIRNLSAKQITNPTVLDNLGHPVSGGLYDLALGAFLRNLCSTCGLDEKFCPGHQGHIELPVPCYNPLFFNQLYIYLRASCLFCHHFRLKSVEVHRYACKLRLLQYGLIDESYKLDEITLGSLNSSMYTDDEAIEDNEDEMDGEGSKQSKDISSTLLNELKSKRSEYVDMAIAKALSDGRTTERGSFTATVNDERKKLVHEFHKKLLSRGKCDNCGMFSPKFRKDGFTKIFETALNEKQITNNRVKGFIRQDMIKKQKQAKKLDGSNEASANDEESFDVGRNPTTRPKTGSTYILSTEVKNILDTVFRKEQCVLQYVFHSRPNLSRKLVKADSFFMDVLVVPPTRFRLPSKLGEEVHENSQNQLLSKVLTTSLLIRDLNDDLSKLQKDKVSLEDRRVIFSRLMNAFVTIQNDVNAFIDSTKAQGRTSGKVPIPGVKQALEKKEGLFRKHMMGKRVNYAARSVISPDPNIETNEIGVPPVFAVKLTYPEPVTAYNIAELRQAVINGPDKWPGATQIQNEDGSLVSLIGMSVEQRKALANQLLTPSSNVSTHTLNKKVYRHIKNRDVVLMNRQPTLHKASMMGHKVRVLPNEKTLRLHYANTGAYNADFDGDEMNMHFPQNENARAEALNLANTDSQYLTPTSGSPVRGLIQDHISAGVWLTSKDSFFTREQYQQYIYGCIRPEDGHTTRSKIVTLPPTIFKPYPLWTGKQIITTVLLNVTPPDMPGINLISKNKIKNEYWGKGSLENEVLFKDGALLCGILDKSQYGASKYGIVHSLHEVYGPEVAAKVLSVLGRLFTNYITATAFTCGMDDLRLTAEGNKWRTDILKTSVDTGREAAAEVTNLDKDTPADDPELLKRLQEILRDNNKSGILDAVTSSKVNAITSQVVSKCVPDGTMKKFPCNSMQAMALSGAKGSNVNVSQIMCLLGQQALEGRRVPVMVSGKTLPSFKPYETDAMAGGYVKGRFYSGIKPQEYYFHCMAGREGLIDTAVKTSRSGYLQRCLTKQLEGVHVSYDNSIRDADGTLVQFMYGGDAIDITKESHMTQFEFCLDNYYALLKKYNPSALIEHLDVESALKYSKKTLKYRKKHSKEPHYKQFVKYDPVLAKYNPAKYLGSVSENFQDKLESFLDKNSKLFKSSDGVNEKKFRALMQLKYMRSLINPGEAVGIIASQSVGEPSTQMTLNTFHFAGHGAANVTLGIPRLREIVMTASAAIKTPQMTLPIWNDVSDEQADTFCKSISKVLLSEVIDKVIVTETTGTSNTAGGNAARSYVIHMRFFDNNEYSEEYDVSKEELQNVISNQFIHLLEAAIVKEIKKQKRTTGPDIGVAVPRLQTDVANSSSNSKRLEEDNDEEQSHKKTKQAVSYDEPDEDEIETMREAEKSSDEEGIDSDKESDSDSEDEDVDMNEQINKSIVEANNNMNKVQRDRQSAIISHHRFITKYNFDDESGKWCEFKLELAADTEKLLMVNIVEEICRKSIIRQIPHIDRCVHPEPENGKRVLVTEGVNFQAMWDQEAFIDVDGITSNDVAAVLKTYGVEAARNTIVNEINNVFSRYAISVSFRHLDLIADMMTRQGTYLAFNRQGMETSTSSFMKMSYETTCQFLTKAVLDNEREQLDSPSARIVVGKLNNVGTGSFDVLAKVPNAA